MKTLLTTLFTFFSFAFLCGQSSIELQLGGSNFLGASFNYSHKIMLVKDWDFSANPKLGVGSKLLPDYGTDMIVHSGLDIIRRRWGLGAEASHFVPNPFLRESLPSGFLAMLIYPNVNYKISFKSKLYFKFSAGIYLPFDEGSSNTQGFLVLPSYDFIDDLIPGASFTFGYSFKV